MEYAVKKVAKQAAAASVAARDTREHPAPAPEPSYRGVRRRHGKYGAEIQHPSNKKRRLWLGLYKTAEEAAHAYDAAARSLQGVRARPNFPNAPPPVPKESTYAWLARFADAHRARTAAQAQPAAAAAAAVAPSHTIPAVPPPRQPAPAPAAAVGPSHAIPASPRAPQPAPAPAARDDAPTFQVLDPAPLAFAFPAHAAAPPQAPVFGAPAPAAPVTARPSERFWPYKRQAAPPLSPALEPQAASFFHHPPLAAATIDKVTVIPQPQYTMRTPAGGNFVFMDDVGPGPSAVRHQFLRRAHVQGPTGGDAGRPA
ncbi:hypothetical protein ACP4OV_014150 [Aristida adscensionis]